MSTTEILQYIITPLLVGIFAILSSVVTVYLTIRQDRKRWQRDQQAEQQKWEREQHAEQQKWERSVAIEGQKLFDQQRTDAAKQCVQMLTEYLQSPGTFLPTLPTNVNDVDTAITMFAFQVNVKQHSAASALFYLMTYFPSDTLTSEDEKLKDNIIKFSNTIISPDDIHKKNSSTAWSEAQALAFTLRASVIGFLRRSRQQDVTFAPAESASSSISP